MSYYVVIKGEQRWFRTIEHYKAYYGEDIRVYNEKNERVA